MKLFENQVERPSNEILKKKRNFSLAIVLGVLALIGTASFAISKVSTVNLKGGVTCDGRTVKTPQKTNVREFKSYNISFKVVNPTNKTIL